MKNLKDEFNNSETKFWNAWNFFDENIKSREPYIKNGKTWVNYYENLFASPKIDSEMDSYRLREYVGNNKNTQLNTEILEKPLKEDEVVKMLKKLKLKKASGLDLISNEMLKYGFDHLKEVILKLFKLILATRPIPSKWELGLISPIYKSGEKLEPDNYRGICVISYLHAGSE